MTLYHMYEKNYMILFSELYLDTVKNVYYGKNDMILSILGPIKGRW
jgi:hypothetical protein